MTKKALSAIVATIILVALVVAVLGLVSSWISKFVTENTQQDTCMLSTIYTLTDASYSATRGEIKVKVRNAGRLDIYNFTVEADNGTVIVSVAASSPDTSLVLGPGKSQYILAPLTSQNITNIDKMTVLVGSCPGYSASPVKVVNI
jgi:FlaG/FlaF family flagellin (archaellin)